MQRHLTVHSNINAFPFNNQLDQKMYNLPRLENITTSNSQLDKKMYNLPITLPQSTSTTHSQLNQKLYDLSVPPNVTPAENVFLPQVKEVEAMLKTLNNAS